MSASAKPAPQSRFVEIDGEPIHYLDWGTEGLPPLVLVHGTGFNASVWEAYGEALRDRFHVVALDQWGFGDSTKAERVMSAELNGRVLAEFIHRVGLAAAFCVGHSMGGASVIAAEAVRPGTVSRAVVIDPIIMIDAFYDARSMSPENNPMVAKTVKRRTEWDSREQMLESYRKKLPFRTWRPDVLEAFVRGGTRDLPGGGIALKCPPAVEAKSYMDAHAWDPKPLLERVRCPVLVVKPDQTHGGGATVPDEVARRLPKGELLDAPDYMHFMPMDDPDRVMEIVLEFEARTRGAIEGAHRAREARSRDEVEGGRRVREADGGNGDSFKEEAS